ncbi:GntR family transcriptional regulator [Actinacidiphila sp. bgisy160]|uniref:GntR family transcriptional regulator n=1 Tax=Actinacidiphila sp. bgisy160 TaxID=3413796 RepID=UPI003D7473A2
MQGLGPDIARFAVGVHVLDVDRGVCERGGQAAAVHGAGGEVQERGGVGARGCAVGGLLVPGGPGVVAADDIRQQITGDTLRAGDKLPSESELMTDYGVSRIVIRL